MLNANANVNLPFSHCKLELNQLVLNQTYLTLVHFKLLVTSPFHITIQSSFETRIYR